MKAMRFTTLAILLLLSLSSLAQPRIYLGGFGGWLWTGKVPIYGGIIPGTPPITVPSQDAKVDDQVNYGANIGLEVRDGMVVEFEWNHTESTFFVRTSEDIRSADFTMNYYMLGFNYHAMDGPLVPYGIVNVGLLNVKSQESESYSQNSFVAGGGFGIKYFLSDMVGIRLQARLLVPMRFTGVSIGCGIGTGGAGCGTGVSSYSNIIQGDFTGGVVLRIGD